MKLLDCTNEQIEQINIYDNFGKQVYHRGNVGGKVEGIDIRVFQTGMYVVKVVSDSSYYTKKFFKSN